MADMEYLFNPQESGTKIPPIYEQTISEKDTEILHLQKENYRIFQDLKGKSSENTSLKQERRVLKEKFLILNEKFQGLSQKYYGDEGLRKVEEKYKANLEKFLLENQSLKSQVLTLKAFNEKQTQVNETVRLKAELDLQAMVSDKTSLSSRLEAVCSAQHRENGTYKKELLKLNEIIAEEKQKGRRWREGLQEALEELREVKSGQKVQSREHTERIRNLKKMELDFEQMIQTKQLECQKFNQMNKKLSNEIFIKEKSMKINENKLKDELLEQQTLLNTEHEDIQHKIETQSLVIKELNNYLKTIELKLQNSQNNEYNLKKGSEILLEKAGEKDYEIELLSSSLERLEASEKQNFQKFHLVEDQLLDQKNKNMQQYLDFRQENEKLTLDFLAMEKQYNELEDEKKELEEEIEDRAVEHDRHLERIDDLQQVILKLKKKKKYEISKEGKTLQGLIRDQKEKKIRIFELENQVKSQNNILNTKKQQISFFKKQLQENNLEVEEESQLLRSQNIVLQQANKTLQQQLQEQQNQILRSQESQSILNQNYQPAQTPDLTQSDFLPQQRQLKQMKLEVTTLKQQNQDLKNFIQDSEKEFFQIQQENAVLKDQVKKFMEKIPDTDNENNQYELEQEVKGLKAEIESLLKEREQDGYVQALREENDRLKKLNTQIAASRNSTPKSNQNKRRKQSEIVIEQTQELNQQNNKINKLKLDLGIERQNITKWKTLAKKYLGEMKEQISKQGENEDKIFTQEDLDNKVVLIRLQLNTCKSKYKKFVETAEEKYSILKKDHESYYRRLLKKDKSYIKSYLKQKEKLKK